MTPGTYARVTTSEGEFTVRLFEQQAPKTVANFVGLAEGTKDPATGKPGQARPFYDGLVFHRIIAGFMLQGGDPQGDGRGGPGYTFTDEFDPTLRFDRAGLLAMANRGPNTNGSQFFITLGAHRVAEQQAHDLRRGRRGDGRHHQDRQRPDGPWRSPGDAGRDEDGDDSADHGIARLRSPAASSARQARAQAIWPERSGQLVSNTVRTGERSPPRPGPRGVSPGAHSTQEVSRGPRSLPPGPRGPSVRARRPSVCAPAVHRRSRARRWRPRSSSRWSPPTCFRSCRAATSPGRPWFSRHLRRRSRRRRRARPRRLEAASDRSVPIEEPKGVSPERLIVPDTPPDPDVPRRRRRRRQAPACRAGRESSCAIRRRRRTGHAGAGVHARDAAGQDPRRQPRLPRGAAPRQGRGAGRHRSGDWCDGRRGGDPGIEVDADVRGGGARGREAVEGTGRR